MRNGVAAAVLAAMVFALVASAQDAPDPPPPPPGPIVLGDCLVLPAVSNGGRSLVYTDPIEHAIVRGTFQPPEPGLAVTGEDGQPVHWRAAKADGAGALNDRTLAGGYLWWAVTVDSPQTRMLEARGHTHVYVNDAPRMGDPYNTGAVKLPVPLRQGVNHLLFRIARGAFAARLVHTEPRVFISPDDATLPDLVAGAHGEHFAGVLIVNAGPEFETVTVTAHAGHGGQSPFKMRMPPHSVRKAAVRFQARAEGTPKLHVETWVGDRSLLGTDSREFELRLRGPRETRKVTFVSAIDGSVQYYAVNPAQRTEGPAPGIVLSLHGASVEATGQAGAYGAKEWCHIVCPTNRRPFGFDWEDWGRLDALEALAHAQATLRHDPSMVYLTGHSMGGHGTWQLGAHFPHRFAAIAPCAGWQSFWTYGGKAEAGDDALEQLLRRADNPSDTLLLKQNYAQHAVYVLHGDADETVPVAEARTMRDALKGFHPDLHYYEEPGGGHWYDRGDSVMDTGADCVDWHPIFDLFARRRVPRSAEVRKLKFATVSPGVSADCHWATIQQQQQMLEPSQINLRADPNVGRIQGETQNVARLALRVADVLRPSKQVTIRIDGAELVADWPAGGVLWLERREHWSLVEALPPGQKGPARYGGFKDAWRNHCQIVYGTGGDEATRQWCLNKARFDAEQFWVRGNGSIDLIADTEFDPAAEPHRNVILVGPPWANRAYAALELALPVRAAPGVIEFGAHRLEGDHALLAVLPRPGSDSASVGIISGTSAAGCMATNRLPYMVSGVGLPDFVVLSPAMLTTGSAGLAACGFLDAEWRYSEALAATRSRE